MFAKPVDYYMFEYKASVCCGCVCIEIESGRLLKTLIDNVKNKDIYCLK